jgi:choline dehydrogenase-like flavoprotein
MLCDARKLSNEELIETDLCIVGSGPAGISIARELRGRGYQICLLESGGRQPERQAQRLNRCQSTGYPIQLSLSRVRAFGGTSRWWWPDQTWACRPLDPIDFEARPSVRYSGWPFDRAHLEPFYKRAHKVNELGPYDYDPKGWTTACTPELPLAAPEIESTMFQHAPGTFNSRYDDLVRSDDVTLFLNASVTDLVPNDAYQCVERVEVRRDDGSRFFVRPQFVVLAGGGIENPRLLLLGQLARGRVLGNDHDLVGRFFAERISAGSGFVVAARPETVDRAGFYDFHAAKGTYVQGALRVTDKIQRERDLLNVVFHLLDRPALAMSPAIRSIATLTKGVFRQPPLLFDLPSHLGNVAAGLGDVAAMVRAYLSRGVPGRRVLMMCVQGEQAPNPDSRVTLGRRSDRFGLPVACIDWRPSAGVRESIRASQEVISAGFKAARLGHVESMLGDEHPPALLEGNFHHLGATRMHENPRRGVVDANCRVHGVHNLYIAGSSVFPTYGASNPTLTILALALRLADHLKQRLAEAPRMAMAVSTPSNRSRRFRVFAIDDPKHLGKESVAIPAKFHVREIIQRRLRSSS